jgi:hypothetical protein
MRQIKSHNCPIGNWVVLTHKDRFLANIRMREVSSTIRWSTTECFKWVSFIVYYKRPLKSSTYTAVIKQVKDMASLTLLTGMPPKINLVLLDQHLPGEIPET